MEADLRDPDVVPRLFNLAEEELSHVDILVNNATGWVADTFLTNAEHLTGLVSEPPSISTHDQVFQVDARGGALMIAEFARRHVARNASWGRILGLTPAARWVFRRRSHMEQLRPPWRTTRCRPHLSWRSMV